MDSKYLNLNFDKFDITNNNYSDTKVIKLIIPRLISHHLKVNQQHFLKYKSLILKF